MFSSYGRVVKMAFDAIGNRDPKNDMVVIISGDGIDTDYSESRPMLRTEMPADVLLAGEDDDLKVITLREAIRRIGYDVIVALDATPDKADWFWFPATGKIGTIDGRLCEADTILVNGMVYLVLKEEPGKVSHPEDGSPRIVGQVLVFRNKSGRIRVRQGFGVNGEVLELNSSSVTKGETIEYAPQGAHFETNPKRIEGFVNPVLIDNADFPDEEGMSVQGFVDMSTDGRAITALAKLGLLVAA